MSDATRIQQRLTYSPAYNWDKPSVKVHKLEIVESNSGVWFHKIGESFNAPLPPDLYLPGREMRSLHSDITLEELFAFCSKWGIFADKYNRDLDRSSAGDYVDLAAASEKGWISNKYLIDIDLLHAQVDASIELGVDVNDLVNPAVLMPRIDAMTNIADLYDSLFVEDFSALGDLELPLIALNSALSVFAPSLVIEGMSDVLPVPTFFNFAALQMVNDLREGNTATKCANTTCGQLFTRQRDRADKGTHRTSGVIYCSKSCATAQGQREYRLRQKAAKNGGNQ